MNGKLNLPLICLVAFFAMSAGALLGPVLPFMVEPLNTTREAVGLILGMYTFSTALAMIGVSFITDRVGRKKILVPCLLINGIAGLACYFSTDMTTLLALRFVQGIGIAGMLPIAMTMIGELYTGLDRVNAMGKMSMTTGIGAVSAPLIGGILASFAWNVPFLFYGLSIPLAIIVAFVLPETNPHENRSKGRNSILKALMEFRILYTIILSFSIFFLLYTMVIYVPFILKDTYGFTASQAGLALGIQGVAMASISSRARSLAAKYGKQKILMAGFSIAGVSLGGLVVAGSLYQVLILIFIFGIGFGMVQPQLNTLATQVAPPGMMGSIVSVFNIMKYAGQTAAPLILAVILFHSDLHMVFATSCVFAFVVVVTSYFFKGVYANLDG
ncbi:MFS transporter [Methanolobus profundi]|uniref:Predicted arabinose efflux permease, MFS family n=1 Tax=Methanolobus profundi TaxID=487685 RepID=A0A1I4QM13_9EURY|nr:MFS transporter [Methanolobus profundi]SFM41118.1 Predicted arabinose efflux permease, MFS family [Methanolobus profundi]